MTEIDGVQITAVEGFTLSDDGETAVMRLKLDGQEAATPLAFSQERLSELLVVLVQATAALPKGKMHKEKVVLPASWWELHKTHDGKLLAFSFRLSNGAEFSFAVEAAKVWAKRETLESLMALASSPPPSGTLQNLEAN
jgi:hypothetical protein